MKLPVLGTVALLSPISLAPQAIAGEPVSQVPPLPEVNHQSVMEISSPPCLGGAGGVKEAVSQPLNAEQTISEWGDQINSAAVRYGVDPALVAAILKDEMERWDRHYFDPSGTRDSSWVYSGDDTVTNTLACGDPDLAVEQKWSVGIAQMTPQTAQKVSNYQQLPAVMALLDQSKSIELVAAWIAKTVEDWRSSYPEIVNRPDIIATLYSQGYEPSDIRGCPTSSVKGCPDSNERGKEIARDLPRLQALLDQTGQYQAAK